MTNFVPMKNSKFFLKSFDILFELILLKEMEEYLPLKE